MTFKADPGPKRSVDASVELSTHAAVEAKRTLAHQIAVDADTMKRSDVSVTRRQATLKADVSLLKSQL